MDAPQNTLNNYTTTYDEWIAQWSMTVQRLLKCRFLFLYIRSIFSDVDLYNITFIDLRLKKIPLLLICVMYDDYFFSKTVEIRHLSLSKGICSRRNWNVHGRFLTYHGLQFIQIYTKNILKWLQVQQVINYIRIMRICKHRR